MLTIQCTKKLQAELKVPLPSGKPINYQSLLCWHSHLFLFNRRKCVLAMNNETRYNFVIFGLKKDSFNRFDEIIFENISANLLADGMDKALIDTYLQDHRQINYTPTSDRSIIGQINDMIMIAQYEMERNMNEVNDPDIEQVNRFLNRFVMLKLPKLYAGETMHDALQRL
jgi:hypothetical protein